MATRVEREAAIGQQDQRNSVGPQHAVDVVKQSQRISDVLEHMTRNDEVECRVAESREQIDVQIAHDVRFGKRGVDQLRIQHGVLVGCPSVDTADRRSRIRDRERVMAGTDVDPVPDEVARQLRPHRFEVLRPFRGTGTARHRNGHRT